MAVETHQDPALEDSAFESLIKDVDMVCVTDWDREGLVSANAPHGCRRADLYTLQIRINDVCRRLNKPFYAGGTYGLLGYIFCDLLQHDYISPCVALSPSLGANEQHNN